MANPVLAQQREIRGQVTGVTGEAIAGALVTVKGTTISALSREDGGFTIRVPAGDLTLVASFLGYRTTEVGVRADQTVAAIEMDLDPLRLEELVVTGTATEISRLNLANTVATLSAEEIQPTPAQTLDKAIQGKVAGALVETNSGAPGGGVQTRLRGVSTINGLSEPLYVVDGVIVSNEAIPSNQNAVTNASTGSNPSLTQDAQVNRIADLNPNEIESIEVLKGASAAAIYGQKASNGVVVITTKRGRPGRPRVRLSQSFGVFDLSKTLGSRRFETADEAAAAFGESARDFFGSDGRPLATFNQEELLAHRNDISFESYLSLSGGSERTQYFASADWKNDEGIIDNTGFERQSIRVNLDQRISPRLSLQFSSNLLHTAAGRGLTNNDNSGTSFYMVFPFTPEFVDLRSDPETGLFPDNPFERSNPLQTAALMANDEDVWRLIGGVGGTWEAIQGRNHNLRILTNFGADYFAQKNKLFFPPDLQFEPDDGLPGTSLLSNSDNLNWNVGANIVYSYRPSSGSWTATTSGGFLFEDRDLNVSRVVSRNLSAGKENVNAGTNIQIAESRAKTRDLGYFLQEDLLALDERLLLSAGGRLDRSSNNGDGGKFFFYPKAAASYRFPDLTSWVNEFKFRVAWGQSGNLPLFGQKFTPLAVIFNVEQNPGVVLGDTLGASNIEPERQNEVEFGFDASAWNGRASLEFTVYQKNITNLLLARELAPSSGFTAQQLNGGELRTRGLEIALAGTPIQNSTLDWLFRTTFFLDRNKVMSLPVPSFRAGGFGTALGAFQIEEGESASQIVAVVSDADSSFVAKVGDATPDFKMAFVNDIKVGNFQIYSLFDWQAGGTVVNLTKLLYDFGQNTADFDENPQSVVNIGPVCAVSLDDGSCDPDGAVLTNGERRLLGFGVETRPFIESATYMKMRELAISYNIPSSLTSSLFGGIISSARITFSGRNLITWTGYSGMDPEVSNFGNQAVGRNIDVAPFPRSRSYWLIFDFDF
ncbi:MAG: SusC/RagA family TonB-linked outer membrane protein [Gemmatimonadota bacterium]|nr:MAG: SusC/RagA family TonB-linked outer membrane protein [Gemmatimonadota bacterium]